MRLRLLLVLLAASACRCPSAPPAADAGQAPLALSDGELSCYLGTWGRQLDVRRSLRVRFDDALAHTRPVPQPTPDEQAMLNADPAAGCRIQPERAARVRELLLLVGPAANDPAKLVTATAQARELFGPQAVGVVTEHIGEVARITQRETEESLELMRRAQQRNQAR